MNDYKGSLNFIISLRECPVHFKTLDTYLKAKFSDSLMWICRLVSSYRLFSHFHYPEHYFPLSSSSIIFSPFISHHHVSPCSLLQPGLTSLQGKGRLAISLLRGPQAVPACILKPYFMGHASSWVQTHCLVRVAEKKTRTRLDMV